MASWVDPAMLWPALTAIPGDGAEARAALEGALAATFGADAVLLMQSGTAALVSALRLAAGPGGIVALPGYACADLVAAAVGAELTVRVYDIDPATLSPDLESVAAALAQGVNAVVVAHLFGYPADVTGVRALAAQAGVPVIEDAAQGAGARVNGRLVGSLSELSILSFGRGKGMSGGGGGALLAYGADAAARLAPVAASLGPAGTGARALVVSAAQWLLGRPSAYWLPSHLPGLRLGEMVYHTAPEPAGIGTAAAILARSALAHIAEDVAVRGANAQVLSSGLRKTALTAAPIFGAEPGYLRFPVLVPGGAVSSPRLGILVPYPRTLLEQHELQPLLLAGQQPTAGAERLCRELVTLPTHYRVTAVDLAGLQGWLDRLDQLGE